MKQSSPPSDQIAQAIWLGWLKIFFDMDVSDPDIVWNRDIDKRCWIKITEDIEEHLSSFSTATLLPINLCQAAIYRLTGVNRQRPWGDMDGDDRAKWIRLSNMVWQVWKHPPTTLIDDLARFYTDAWSEDIKTYLGQTVYGWSQSTEQCRAAMIRVSKVVVARLQENGYRFEKDPT